jgi:hypothetical protein
MSKLPKDDNKFQHMLANNINMLLETERHNPRFFPQVKPSSPLSSDENEPSYLEDASNK